ncbi:organic cation transporter-like protein [Amphibalanus amphitrite]|uniref:organic cation transporter-like protein n=1 Tax=Amphibalanus amphitrite TaxID=1232801 RepID=UPI001C90E2FA|nr:organic cation transporter-like protein [Amphibalanus amphitrite]
MLDVDATFVEINGWGRYQKLMYLLLCLPTSIAGAAVISLSWTGFNMKYRCLVPACENATSATYEAWFLNFTTPRDADPSDPAFPWSECQTFQPMVQGQCNAGAFNETVTQECSQWVYDTSIMEYTIVSEYQLSCGRAWLISLANSLYMVGMFVGSLVLGYISDRFGRKVAMLLSFFTVGVVGTTMAFVPSFALYAPLRFLIGVGGMGIFMTCFLLGVETVSNDVRTLCGMIIHFFFPFGEAMVAVFAIFVKDWHSLQLIISVPAFIFMSYYFFVPESPRWLAAEGKFEQAERNLRTAARFNGVQFPDHLLKKQSLKTSDSETPILLDDPPQMSVLDLFRTPALRWRTLIILYQWFVTAMVYYGLGMNATQLGSSVYVNFILVQLIEIPAAISCIFVLDPWGRKLSLALFFALSGIGSIVSGVCSSGRSAAMETITVAMAVLGKYGSSATFAIVFVYGAELFPTDLRNSGIGMSSAAGRVGSIIAPFIISLGGSSQVLPMTIFGVLSLIGAFITVFLPETYGENLPDTIEETESFGKDQSLCFIPCLNRRRARKVEPSPRSASLT